jgi:hypothetical protein
MRYSVQIPCNKVISSESSEIWTQKSFWRHLSRQIFNLYRLPLVTNQNFNDHYLQMTINDNIRICWLVGREKLAMIAWYHVLHKIEAVMTLPQNHDKGWYRRELQKQDFIRTKFWVKNSQLFACNPLTNSQDLIVSQLWFRTHWDKYSSQLKSRNQDISIRVRPKPPYPTARATQKIS